MKKVFLVFVFCVSLFKLSYGDERLIIKFADYSPLYKIFEQHRIFDLTVSNDLDSLIIVKDSDSYKYSTSNIDQEFVSIIKDIGTIKVKSIAPDFKSEDRFKVDRFGEPFEIHDWSMVYRIENYWGHQESSLQQSNLFEFVEIDQEVYRCESVYEVEDYYWNSGPATIPWYQTTVAEKPEVYLGQYMQLERALAITKGEGIRVGVVDSGTDEEHFDLDENIIEGEIVHIGDHGTKVSSIIGAEVNNLEQYVSPLYPGGMAGVAPLCSLIPMCADESSIAEHVEDIVYLMELPLGDRPHVINISWGGVSGSIFLEDAIEDAFVLGIIVVAAAGNNPGPLGFTPPYLNWPAAYGYTVIGVGGCNPTYYYDEDWNFNYNPLNESFVDFSAPSIGIRTAIPGGSVSISTSGTSYSTPIVSGVIALLLSYDNMLTQFDIVDILQETCEQVGQRDPQLYPETFYSNGYSDAYGWGRVHAYHALLHIIPPTIVDQFPTGSNVSPTSDVRIVFHEHQEMSLETMTYDEGNIIISGSQSGIHEYGPLIYNQNYDEYIRDINLEITDPFILGETVTVTLNTAIENNGGANLEEEYQWTFQVASDPVARLEEGSVNPISGITTDLYNFNVVFFDEGINSNPPDDDISLVIEGNIIEMNAQGTSWSTGVEYTYTSAAYLFSEGTHQFHFEGMQGANQLRFPESGELEFTVSSIITPPSEVIDLTITISGNDAILDWTEISNAESYKIYRSSVPYFNLTGNLITSVINPPWTDDDALNGETYFYNVTAEGNSGTPGIEQDFELGNTGVYITMVWIPPGSFMQGAYAGEVGAGASEYPQHLVTFNYGFWLGKYEVTQEQWEAITGSNPSYYSGDNLPVESVSWDVISNDFLIPLNNQTSSSNWRLPSESEWEYACRAGTETRFYWGDDLYETAIGDYAWYNNNSGSQTHEIGTKYANTWGLFDMSGNVWEWCEDYAHSNYSGAPTNGGPWLSPISSLRVLRGGCWNSSAVGSCRSAARGSLGQSATDYYYGFRLVRDAEQQVLEPTLEGYELEPVYPQVEIGESFTARYQVNNPNSFEIDILLDARWRDELSVYGELEPVTYEVTLQPGLQWVERPATVTLAMDPGLYAFAWYLLDTDNSVITSSGYIDDSFVVETGGAIIEQDFELGNTGVYITMIWIPPGSFMQGAYEGELGADPNEAPQHEVTLNYGFWLGKYEVTQEQWEAITGENPSHSYGIGDNYPVYFVSWNTIVNDFLVELNSQTPGDPWRLPSESEWEYACRAGTETRYYWGDDLNYTEIGNYAWYTGNSGGQTHEVGQKLPNDWGLYDMSGNVYDWVEDYWHNNYNGAPTNGSAWLSPSSSYLVFRGGSWNGEPYSHRSAYRFGHLPSYATSRLGFRLLRDAD